MMKYIPSYKPQLAVLLLSTSLWGCSAPPEQPSDVCIEALTQSQQRQSARNQQLVTAMVEILQNKAAEDLSPESSEDANTLASAMREVFLRHREVLYDQDNTPTPITAGSGFGTLDDKGNAKNLFGIYQSNTPSAACSYPFSPPTALPISPGDTESPTVPFVASPLMKGACALLASCKSMDSSLFLNTANITLNSTEHKLFFNNTLHSDENKVFKTFSEWHPGGTASNDTNWVQRGWEDYQNGDTEGHYVVYEQSDMGQFVLLYYRPFEDSHGQFAGVAYAFVNLYEEYLANDDFFQSVDNGLCPAPRRSCSTGE